jgi:hypothetical protein
MKRLRNSLLPMSLLIVCILSAAQARAEVGIRIEAPVRLPRNIRLGDYSPALRLEYTAVPKGRFRLKLWLLESATGDYYCASTQLCGREFDVDNTSGSNVHGAVLLAEDFDVFDYSSFLWVARLYAENDREIASARLAAASAVERPPALHRVGSKSCVAGEQLRFKVSAAAAVGQTVRFSARYLPPGAEINPDTGEFSWKPAEPGKFPGVVVEASASATGLTDAEIIEIEVKAAK